VASATRLRSVDGRSPRLVGLRVKYATMEHQPCSHGATRESDSQRLLEQLCAHLRREHLVRHHLGSRRRRE
jgi:hypothetical protein